jgi:hypothetical protein
MHDKLIGPFFFSEKTVTGRSYLDILELYELPQLPPQTNLQQNGSPPYFCHHVRNDLDWEMDRQRWTNCLASWVARFNPIRFFFWGYVKNIVYQVKINDLQHLKFRIKDALATVTPNMPQATWDEVEYRPDICRATKGAHIEIY